MRPPTDTLNAVSAKLATLDTNKKALIGFDGYVDRIQRPIQSENKGDEQYFASLDTFGKHVSDAAGLSTQVCLNTDAQKLGGNGPIMANALGHLQINNTCMGPFGEPEPEPVFAKMHSHCQLVSLGFPAQTNALEFTDGKLILSEVSVFKTLDWNRLESKVSLHTLTSIASETNLIALVDWSNMPFAGDLWSGLLTKVLQPNSLHPMVFFDLADPGKRGKAEILKILELISTYGAYTEVVLGLNKNEAILVYEALYEKSGKTLSTLDLTTAIYDKLSLAQLAVHPIDACCVCSKNGSFYLKGRYLTNTKISTGGGDNFNAGYCFGVLHGFSEMEAMAMAIAVSGAYVQNGESPNIEAVLRFLGEWNNSLK